MPCCCLAVVLYNAWVAAFAFAPAVDKAIEFLESLHPNIRVLDSPHYFQPMWSHHQKFIVVDRAVAIVGGIDWTMSRWDNIDHNLFDPKEALHPGLDARQINELGCAHLQALTASAPPSPLSLSA